MGAFVALLALRVAVSITEVITRVFHILVFVGVLAGVAVLGDGAALSVPITLGAGSVSVLLNLAGRLRSSSAVARHGSRLGPHMRKSLGFQ